MFKCIFALFFILVLNSSAAEGVNNSNPRLIQNKPIYFLVGSPDTKVQFSFMVKTLNHFELYASYSQLMMWDLFKVSSPIRDINYNPELFYRLYTDQNEGKWFDLGVIEHESNGQPGAVSRSWNRSYLRYHSMDENRAPSRFGWSIKLWYPYGFDPTNLDIANYRGYFEFQFVLSDFLGSFFGPNDLTLRLYMWGQEISLRSHSSMKALAGTVVFQLFHGYGENLLDYQSERYGIRLGIGF